MKNDQQSDKDLMDGPNNMDDEFMSMEDNQASSNDEDDY